MLLVLPVPPPGGERDRVAAVGDGGGVDDAGPRSTIARSRSGTSVVSSSPSPWMRTWSPSRHDLDLVLDELHAARGVVQLVLELGGDPDVLEVARHDDVGRHLGPAGEAGQHGPELGGGGCVPLDADAEHPCRSKCSHRAAEAVSWLMGVPCSWSRLIGVPPARLRDEPGTREGETRGDGERPGGVGPQGPRERLPHVVTLRAQGCPRPLEASHGGLAAALGEAAPAEVGPGPALRGHVVVRAGLGLEEDPAPREGMGEAEADLGLLAALPAGPDPTHRLREAADGPHRVPAERHVRPDRVADLGGGGGLPDVRAAHHPAELGGNQSGRRSAHAGTTSPPTPRTSGSS